MSMDLPLMAVLAGPGSAEQGTDPSLGAYLYLYALLAVAVLALLRSVLLRRKVDAHNAELIQTNARLTEEIAARQRAQAELAVNRDALDRAHRLTGLGSWRHVKGEKTAWWSDHMYRLFGYEPDEIVPDRDFLADHVHPDDRQVFRDSLEQARLTLGELDMEVRFRRRDGQWRLARVKGRANTDRDGRPAVAGAFLDITEAKAAGQALETSEKRLRLALDAANDGLWQWNVATGETFFSPRWYTMLGMEPDELPPCFETWIERIHPDDKKRVEAVVSEAVASGQPYFVEYRMRAKDGRWPWMLSRGRATAFDGHGAAQEVHGTTSDITLRKEAELALQRTTQDVERLVEQRTEELRQANQRMQQEIEERGRAESALRDSELLFRQLMSNIDQAFWMRDVHSGDYVFVSPACETLVGRPLTPRSNEAFPLMDFVHPLDRARVFDALQRSQDNAYATLRTEFRILRADGSVRWVSAGVFPVQDAQGRTHRLAGTATDISRRKSVETSLEMSQQRLETIFNSVNEGIMIHDVTGQPIDVNDKALEMLGLDKEEAMRMSIEDDLSGPDVPVEELAERWNRVVNGEPQFFPWQARRPKDGSVFPVEVYMRKVRLGLKDAILASVTDVTIRRQAEAEVRTLSMAVEQSPVSVFITDPEGIITYANPKSLEVLGHARGKLIGADQGILHPDGQSDPTYMDIRQTLTAGREWSGDVCTRTADGRDIWQSASISPIKDQDGRIVSYVAVMEDITVKKQREEQIRHMALHDTLTGLPNRILFMDRLAQAVERVQRSGSRLAVMYIDLDNFKPVNDSLGHDTGDRVLEEVARRFQECVRKVDTVARIGGDEFVTVLQDVQDLKDVDIAAKRILDSFIKPMEAAPGFKLGASIGISTCPKHGYNPDLLIQRADQAMYEAKQAGRNTFRYAE